MSARYGAPKQAVNPALQERIELLFNQEIQAERKPCECLAGHEDWAVPGRACSCGLTLLASETAAYFNVVFLGGVERRRSAALRSGSRT